MRPVHTVGKIPGCFGNRNRRFLHTIRLSEFTDMSIRDANRQSSALGPYRQARQTVRSYFKRNRSGLGWLWVALVAFRAEVWVAT
jgi:hypothetical protein